MRSEEALIAPKSEYFTYHPSAVASQVYLYPVSIGYFYYEPGYSLTRSRFDSFLLMHIIRGACRVTLTDGEIRHVPEGRYILLDCYAPQAYAFDVASEVSWLHFDGCNARAYFNVITQMHGQVLEATGSLTPSTGIRSILDLFRGSHTLHEARVSNTITGILQSLLEQSTNEPNTSSRSYVIERARTYISEHYAQQITLETLAAGANLSPYHFTRVFSAETGFTPHQYLIAVRLSAARYQLSSPALPSIKEIAHSCGFHSESSFCTTFRKWEGKTPSEYRMAAFGEAAT